jgi:hypothetical protein
MRLSELRSIGFVAISPTVDVSIDVFSSNKEIDSLDVRIKPGFEQACAARLAKLALE